MAGAVLIRSSRRIRSISRNPSREKTKMPAANPPTTPSENDPLTYTWIVTKDGNAYTSGTGSTANFQVVDNGSYVVTMTVTDGDGGSDTAGGSG